MGWRARTPASPLVGAMWHSTHAHSAFGEVRHTCEQGDLAGYGYTRHDGHHYGEAFFEDPAHLARLHSSFLLRSSSSSSLSGEEWSVRITGEKAKKAGEDAPLSVLFYIAVPKGGVLQLEGPHSKKGLAAGEIRLDGETAELGGFSLVLSAEKQNVKRPKDVVKTPGLSDLSKVHFVGLLSETDDRWQVDAQVKSMFQTERQRIYTEYLRTLTTYKKNNPLLPHPPAPEPLYLAPTLPNTLQKNYNILVFQYFFHLPFTLDIAYLSHTVHPELQTTKSVSGSKAKYVFQPISNINLENWRATGSRLTNDIKARQALFDQRFESTFALGSKGFNVAQQEFAKRTFSSLVGGIGFFSGEAIVKRDGVNVFTPSQSLLTAVPSRSFFPRGFFWDEGFHALLMHPFDPKLPQEIWRSWFSLVTETGWIPREQILGPEARSRVPEQFQAQSDSIANPPTFLFLLRSLMKSLKQSPTPMGTISESDILPSHYEPQLSSTIATSATDNAREFLQHIFPLAARHYNWFITSQSGPVPFSYRWRGQTVNHTLASGLDDYPRGPTVDASEQHVDLLCWVTLYASTMADIAKLIGDQSSATYQATYDATLQRIESVHWEPHARIFADISHMDKNTNQQILNPHIGYVGLMPLMLGLLRPDAPQVEELLQHIQNTNELWSDYGVRSLAKNNSYYGTNENYWRGPIWLNFNYLLLSSLHNYYMDPQLPCAATARSVYTELRNNVIQNVYQVYQKTGYVWEQYNPVSGKGQGCRPFTGWSALIVLIMAEQYPA